VKSFSLDILKTSCIFVKGGKKMSAHVFIVNSDTFPIQRDKGFLSIFQEDRTKELWEKTRADIWADLTCLRIGDRIFFYELNTGFHGIYEVTSLPFIDKTTVHGVGENRDKKISNAPYRALIRPKYYLKNPLPESRAFGLKDSPNRLRSIFYKKVLGRGKANTHLFPDEEKRLTELLFKANDGVDELQIHPYKPKEEKRIFYDLSVNQQGELKFEKILEGWITQNIDKPETNTSLFLGDLKDIECFANYVPVNIAGGNIDLIVYHKKKINGIEIMYKITIVELKKGGVNKNGIIEIENYVKWATENIASSDVEIIQPVLIGRKILDNAIDRCKHYAINDRKPILIEYNVEPSKYFINFVKRDY
jgi:hypothetical protein